MKIVKVLLKTVLAIVVIFVLVSGGGMFYLTRGLDAGQALEIGEADLSVKNDGVYSGAYTGGRWSNQVDVTVKDHKITEVKVVKDVRFPKPEVTAELVAKVILEQSPKVDAVSGSTVTCKAYLKAVENALTK